MDKIDFCIAVNKFFYFAMNYPMGATTYKPIFGEEKTEYLPTFLGEIDWHCGIAHMVDKWKGIENCDSYGRMMRFYAELDGKNRVAFLEWVNDNYELKNNYGLCM